MRNNLIVLLNALGALLTGSVGIVFAASVVSSQFLNYREQNFTDWAYSWMMTGIAVWCLGIYTLALLVRQRSRQALELEPLFSIVGCVLGLLIGCGSIYVYSVTPFLQQISFLWFWVLFLPLLLSIVGFLIACRFKTRRGTRNLILSASRILVPSAIALALIGVNYSGFPGVNAPAEIRQLWAYKEFGNYDGVVNSIKQCRPVVERIGAVRFVAPTRGKNFVIADPGSSGHSGELTLEVVGEKGTGVANFQFHIGTVVSYIQFTHQNKIEKLACFK